MPLVPVAATPPPHRRRQLLLPTGGGDSSSLPVAAPAPAPPVAAAAPAPPAAASLLPTIGPPDLVAADHVGRPSTPAMAAPPLRAAIEAPRTSLVPEGGRRIMMEGFATAFRLGWEWR